jgi:uncharacterized protein (DUF58 family)
MPEPLLRAIDLDLSRRIDGLFPGEHRSTSLGPGTELAQIRPYVPGDDVRLIDWNVTARTGEPHVRVQVAERTLTTWLLLDVSASMGFGTQDRRKADVAEGVALAVGYASTRRGNRLGVLTFGGPAPRTLPPRQGRAGVQQLLRVLPGVSEQAAGPTSVREALARAGRVVRRRSLVVAVSDFRGPLDWRAELVRLATASHVVAVEVRDPREQELVDVGDLWLVDPETGKLLRVDTSSRRLRERFAARAADERAELGRLLRSAGADHVVLETRGDWLAELAGVLGRGRAGGGRAGVVGRR